MSIKAGQFLHDANGFVVDRIQTGGVTNLNIPQEKIYELGNYATVATIRDIPDLSFEIESLDCSTEIEALLLGIDPTTTIDGDSFDFTDALPLDVISPFKSRLGDYDIVKGVGVPYLNLENVQYRFGVRQNATQTFTLRGDSVYYIQGSPYRQEFTITTGTNQQYNFAHTAQTYTESGDTIYVLGACAKNVSTGAYKRLFFGTDFTNTSAHIITLANLYTLGYTKLHIVYGSTAAATYGTGVHQGASIKPAAIRGKDIDVYVSDGAATPTMVRWGGVQSVDVQRRVNLDNDEEFGNYHYVAQDYDTADVTGSITIKPADPDDLWSKIAQVANVTTSVVAGPHSSVPLPVEVRISSPDTGSVIKTLYVADARFVVPNVQGRVQQKLTATFSFTSDAGSLVVYQADKP